MKRITPADRDAAERGLFQERLRSRPFWMLVACILVNQTNWKQAKSVHTYLMGTYGSAGRLADAAYNDIELVLYPLGLSSRRAQSLLDLAKVWRRFGGGWHRRHYRAADIMKLPGCGRYAADSWAIFIEGRRGVRPTDRKLRAYLARARRSRDADMCHRMNLTQVEAS